MKITYAINDKLEGKVDYNYRNKINYKWMQHVSIERKQSTQFFNSWTQTKLVKQ